MDEKKSGATSIQALIEKGKAQGRLSTNDIDAAIVEVDMDIEDLDKLYETLEQNNIEIIDDLGDAALETLNFDLEMPKAVEMGAVDNSKNAAMVIFLCLQQKKKYFWHSVFPRGMRLQSKNLQSQTFALL